MATSAPNYWVVAPPNLGDAYTTVAGPAALGAQPVVNWQPGLPVSAGTIIMQPNTGGTLPGAGYHVALQNTILDTTPPTFFQSNERFHFCTGPSGTFNQ